jgi:translation initiation factor eIF-2B subunit delta
VIRSYTVPAGNSLSRHLPAHLSPQITHIVKARPLSVSMGNAIRYLKWEIAQLDVDLNDEEVGGGFIFEVTSLVD